MKKLFVICCLLFPCLVFAQDYKTLKRKADSLRYVKDFKDAVIIYDQCIDLVLTGKQKVYDVEWNNLLLSAINANKINPIKYSAMLYGTRAEKMSDKIETLKGMGVKNILSFYRQSWSTLYNTDFPYGCPMTDWANHILVWAVNDDVFMQAFNTCNTYKTVKMNDKKLYDLLEKHINNMVKEKIKPMIMKSHDIIPIYTFEFYQGTNLWKKAP